MRWLGSGISFPTTLTCTIDSISYVGCSGSFSGQAGVVNGLASDFHTILVTEAVDGNFTFGAFPGCLSSQSALGLPHTAIPTPEPEALLLTGTALLLLILRKTVGKTRPI